MENILPTMSEYAPYGFWLLVYFVAFIAAGHALINKRHSSSAVGWIAVCLLLPLVGPLLYYLIGINRIGSPDRKDRRLNLARRTSPELTRVIPEQYHQLVKLGDAVTGWPAIAGNNITPLFDGQNAFPDMIDSVKKATREVLLSSYIFESNETGKRFIDALSHANTSGVNTRVLVDGVGELYSFPWAHRLMRRKGIQAERFIPPSLLPPTFHMNLRNHRKILVVDQSVAYMGGINIGDRYLTNVERNRAKTSDVHFRCEGPIATAIRQIFCDDWQFATGESLDRTEIGTRQDRGDMVCRAVADGPGKNLLKLQLVMIAAINAATKCIAIMTPYFVPPDE
ncbi:MAG: phospholipase D-like domain-containing protein, partial [Pseudomonadota bacterium]